MHHSAGTSGSGVGVGVVVGVGVGVGCGETDALGAGDVLRCAFEGDLFRTGVADGLGDGDGDFEGSGLLLSVGFTTGGVLVLGDSRLYVAEVGGPDCIYMANAVTLAPITLIMIMINRPSSISRRCWELFLITNM